LPPHRSLYERAFFAARRRDPELTFEAWHRVVNFTGADGTLVRRFLPDGALEVQVEAAGYRPTTLPATVRRDTVRALRVVLRP
jgi:hypothetical protein